MSPVPFRCVIAAALIFILPASGVRGDDVAVQRIVDQWAKAPVAKTGRLKCLHLTLMSRTPDELIRPIGGPQPTAAEEEQADAAKKLSLTPEEFGQLFEEVLAPLADSPDGFAALQRDLAAWLARTGRTNGKQIDIVCSRLTIVQDGENVKNDEQYLENRRIRSRRGKRFATYDASEKTAQLSRSDTPAGAAEDDVVSFDPEIHSMEELRYPAAAMDAEALKQLKQMKLVQAADGREARLVGPQGEVVFETASGFVRRATGLDGAGGALAAELRYARPQQMAGGVELPTASAHVQYWKTKKGEVRLYHAEVFVMQSAELNAKIAPGEFAIPASKGTLIQDAGDPPRDLYTQTPENTLKSDVPDLMELTLPLRKKSAAWWPGLELF